MITQTLAIFLDAYRELNARKLFWITLFISVMVVVVFAFVGLDAEGVTFFSLRLPFPVNTKIITPAEFYKRLFAHLGMMWLTPCAVVLAVISTASIFPDLISGGSIDLYLSKPISRLRLFITKYLAGLLFVALQVLVFCAASFLLIGIRGDAWVPGLFIAVPLVLLYFSYLYAICVLVGLITRSSLAAVLATVMFFFLIWGLHFTESMLLLAKSEQQQKAVVLDERIEQAEMIIAVRTRPVTRPTTATSLPAEDLARLQTDLASLRQQRKDVRNTVEPWHRLIYSIKTLFPKLTETVDLMNRLIIDDLVDQEAIKHASREKDPGQPFSEAAALEAGRDIQTRPVSWVIGTSLLFEAVIVALAAVLFVRRDY